MGAKDRFSSLDTLALLRELQALGRARFDKAHGLASGRYVLTFRVQGEGRRDLVVVPGRAAYFVAGEREAAEEPGGFVSELRRVLSGATLVEGTQPGGERYLELQFARVSDPQPSKLVLELFHPGNLILVREERIIAVAAPRSWAHRNVRVGAPYTRPPSRTDPLRLKEGEVANALAASSANLVSSLATRLSLGGPLAEELLARSGRDGNEPASKEPDTVAREVLLRLEEVLREVGAPPKGYVYRRGGEGTPVDVTPYPSVRWKSDPTVKEEVLATFSEAALLFFESQRVPVPTAQDQERRRLERLREKQGTIIRSLEGAVESLRSSADTLLTNFAEAEHLLKEALAEDPEVEAVQVQVGGISIELQRKLTLRQNAQAFYDESKVLQSKLEGAREALANTEASLAALTPASGSKGRPPNAGPLRSQRARTFWFEKSPRWLITSKGLVAVAGKDARSNDWVVKRNLRAGDLYFHADVHGAPSVIVRCPEKSVPSDDQLREIGQWAVSYSKAWRAGHASADAFWVRDDQVAKAGASGEFVPAGSWVIHGTKNYLKDLPIELGVGTVTWEGEPFLMVGPPSSFVGPGRRLLWRLTPGDEATRRDVERELSKDTGSSLELIQSLLPGGGVQARRA